MKRTSLTFRRIVILALAGAACTAVTAAVAQNAAKPKSLTPAHLATWDNYKILTDRNIFDRFRKPPQPRTTERPSPRPTYTPRPRPPVDSDQYVVLLGIGLEGDTYTAFFEDGRAGKILQIHLGDSVGKGRCVAFAVDAVQYERGGNSQIIKIGHTLTGSEAPANGLASTSSGSGTSSSSAGASSSSPGARPAGTTTRPATTQPTSAPSSDAAPASGSSNLQDILERMRRRRQQELGR